MLGTQQVTHGLADHGVVLNKQQAHGWQHKPNPCACYKS
jgi:hypothetical protein